MTQPDVLIVNLEAHVISAIEKKISYRQSAPRKNGV